MPANRVIAGIAIGLVMFGMLATAPTADEGGLGGALQEARLVSSYYQFARRCQIDGAITHRDLLDFRQRLLDALFDKYALGLDEEIHIIRVIDDDDAVIATAGLSLTPAVCMSFLGSI